MSRLAEDLEESLLAVVVNRDSCKHVDIRLRSLDSFTGYSHRRFYGGTGETQAPIL